jgi:hypothetical protein
MKKISVFALATSLLILPQPSEAFDLKSVMDKAVETIESTTSSTGSSSSISGLTTQQIKEGLTEALRTGTETVLAQIGQTGGYLDDSAIHIPLPEKVQQVKNILDKFGLSSLAGDVETKLNRAAEQAAPQTKEIFFNAIQKMTFENAKAIYNGPKDAATQYFKTATTTDLQKLIEPVVTDNLKDVGALQAYDSLISQYKTLPFVPDLKTDLVDHTTELAISGIFHYLAQEEAAIRENPAKRTSDILKTVFGQ